MKLEELFETVLGSITNKAGEEIPVYINPSTLELKRLRASVKKYPQMPFIMLSDGRCIFWRPYTLHIDIIRRFASLGIADDSNYITGILSVDKDNDDAEVYVTASMQLTGDQYAKNSLVKNRLLTNPYLKEHFHLNHDVSYWNEDIVGKWEDVDAFLPP